MRVGPVQRIAPARAGVWHAQHPAQQLLHRRRAGELLQRTQHIGKRAIPAFAQRLHGDDKAHRAAAGRQVQPFEFTRVARRDLDLLGRNVQLVFQIAAQCLGRHFGVLVLRLEQHDGPHIAKTGGFVLQRFAFEPALVLHGGKHRLLPALRMFGQRNRQLDHAFSRQLLRADVVQHIGFGRNWRGRQLQNRARVQTLEGGKALVGLGVVRFVDDQQRAVQRQPVGQAPARLAFAAAQHARAVGRHIGAGDHRIGQVVQHPQPLFIAARKMPFKVF